MPALTLTARLLKDYVREDLRNFGCSHAWLDTWSGLGLSSSPA
jgi:hypothetical protein